jgi:hypothetical protein
MTAALPHELKVPLPSASGPQQWIWSEQRSLICPLWETLSNLMPGVYDSCKCA